MRNKQQNPTPPPRAARRAPLEMLELGATRTRTRTLYVVFQLKPSSLLWPLCLGVPRVALTGAARARADERGAHARADALPTEPLFIEVAERMMKHFEMESC